MTFLDILLRASIECGLLIIVLYAALRFIPSLDPRVRVWLWRIVFVKLAISLLPLGAISLNVLPASQPTLDQTSDITTGTDDVQQAPTAPKPGDWAWAWIAGASVAGIYMVRRYASARALTERGHRIENPSLAEEADRLARAANLKRAPLLVRSDQAVTALVVGGRTPTIVLPTEQQNADDVRLMLAHEIAHVAHRDLEWNVLFSIVQVLFFFHPCVWLALHAAQQAQEGAADSAAIRLTQASPKRYGEMLLRATLSTRATFSLSAGLQLGASTRDIRKRLNDLRYINVRPSAGRFALMIALISFVVAMTPAYQLGVQQPAPPAMQPRVAMETPAPPAEIALTPPPAQKARNHAQRARTDRVRVKTKHGYRTIRVTTIAPPATVVSVRPASVGVGRSFSVSAAPAIAEGISVSPTAATSSIAVSAPARATSAPNIAVTTVTPPAPATAPAAVSSVSPTVATAPSAPTAITVQAAVPAKLRNAPVSTVRVTTSSVGGTAVTTVTHDVHVTTAVGVGVGHGVGRGVSTTSHASKKSKRSHKK